MNASYAAEAELRRSRILAATLIHVPFDGWTWRSVARGAKDAGYAEAESHLAFPDGIRDVVTAYSSELNRRMETGFAARTAGLAAMKVRERIACAVRTRLEAASGEREAVRRMVAFLALPENVGLGPKLLWATVDSIWRAAGDRSTDFNFYTKRGLLAGVVGATTLYWLADKSEGFADTWAFLDRRIDEVIRIGGWPRRVSAWIDSKAEALFRRRDRSAERSNPVRWPGRRATGAEGNPQSGAKNS